MNLFSLVITKPLGLLINLIYGLFDNYGIAIIIFTLIIKTVLIPLTFKSQKSIKKQQKLQPFIAELQKKYANDSQKLQTEMMKLYRENDVSMMGGCLPMLIQMPILIGLYQVIQKPLTYLIGVDFKTEEALAKAGQIQQFMIENFPSKIDAAIQKYTPEQLVKISQISLSRWSELTFGKEDPWVLNFNFFGMDLSNVPKSAFMQLFSGNFSDPGTLLLIIIPVIAVLTTWFSMKLSQAQVKKKSETTENSEPNPADQMSKQMSIMGPVMTGFFTVTLPSGLGLYWIISNIVQITQQYLINKYFDKKEDDINVKVPESNRKNRKKHK
ncbi:MAG: YidC/Oxa1 family membrane protein insertase [Oscillospiraceae bacterium]|nr:YidC/Oxa1 family membrane protein insertase [Oscillospiraceae bacterium]